MMQMRMWAVLMALVMMAAGGVDAAGRGAMDVRSRQQAVRMHVAHGAPPTAIAADNAATDSVYVPVIVDLNSDMGLDEIREMGGVVFYTRGGMALACIPRRGVDALDRSQYVDGMSLARQAAPAMDKARALTFVDTVHAGDATATPAVPGYDGTGVVTGICDTGFDPDHIAFNATPGKLGMVVNYVDTLARRTAWAPGTTLHTEGTRPVKDNPHETHASHVANILAGSYKGNAYYGAAPGATLAVTTSVLTDVGLLSGIEDIIAFARQKGMPAVVNLSVSSYLGPHDGTDLVNRYLDELGKEAIIVFSAGNNGKGQYGLAHTFTEDGEMAGSLFESSETWSGFKIRGATDIWSADDHAFDIQLVVWDRVSWRVVYESPWLTPGGDGTMEIGPGHDDDWDRIMGQSVMRVTCGHDRYNGRYTAALDYWIDPVEAKPGTLWARCYAGWRVRARAGMAIDAYTEGQTSYMRAMGMPGQSEGTTDLTINNLGCNDHTVTVGSWNSRTDIPLAGGGQYLFSDYAANTVSAWSSYGTLRDGRRLPHVCAPGNIVMSAMSGGYEDFGATQQVCLEQEVGGTTHSWISQRGTSMASPLAAGVFALWLQADPTLTIERVREIAQTTARLGFADDSDPRWGAGALDALAGMEAVLQSAGVGTIIAPDDNALAVTVNSDRTLTVTCRGKAVSHAVHNMQGQTVAGDGPLAPGIYIVTAAGHARRVAVR